MNLDQICLNFANKTNLRALSDSSINQTVSNAPSQGSFHTNNFQPNYGQNYEHQNNHQVYQNYPSANFQLSFNDYETQQSGSILSPISNVTQQKFFKNVRNFFVFFSCSTERKKKQFIFFNNN